MKVNGRIPEIKDAAQVRNSADLEEEEKPMYRHKHDHEEVPAQLLTSNAAGENQFQVSLR